MEQNQSEGQARRSSGQEVVSPPDMRNGIKLATHAIGLDNRVNMRSEGKSMLYQYSGVLKFHVRDKKTDTDRKMESSHPLTHFLNGHAWPALGQAQVGSWTSAQVSRAGAQKPSAPASPLLPRVCISRRLESGARDGNRTPTP